MYKRFKPLFGKSQEEEDGEKFVKEAERLKLQEEISRLKAQKENLEAQVKSLNFKLTEAQEERKKLLQEIENLKAELSLRDRQIEDLKSQVENLKSEKTALENIRTQIVDSLNNCKEEIFAQLKKSFLIIGKEAVKEFLLSDEIPKEDLVEKLLEEIFRSEFELKGYLKVVVNPKDRKIVEEFFGKADLYGEIDLDIREDETLMRGEIKLETPKFLIERNHREIADTVVKEVIAREFKGSQDLREGSQG